MKPYQFDSLHKRNTRDFIFVDANHVGGGIWVGFQ